jgi:hypothetical protein
MKSSPPVHWRVADDMFTRAGGTTEPLRSGLGFKRPSGATRYTAET